MCCRVLQCVALCCNLVERKNSCISLRDLRTSCVCVCVNIHMHIYASTYVCIYTKKCMHIIYMYTYISNYTHSLNQTHTHTHTHTHAATWASPCVRHRVVKEHTSNCSTTAYNSSHGQISDDSCPSRDNFFCVLQCVAVCCSVLQCVAECCSEWNKTAHAGKNLG